MRVVRLASVTSLKNKGKLHHNHSQLNTTPLWVSDCERARNCVCACVRGVRCEVRQRARASFSVPVYLLAHASSRVLFVVDRECTCPFIVLSDGPTLHPSRAKHNRYHRTLHANRVKMGRIHEHARNNPKVSDVLLCLETGTSVDEQVGVLG
jgi:hypothetical protein